MFQAISDPVFRMIREFKNRGCITFNIKSTDLFSKSSNMIFLKQTVIEIKCTSHYYSYVKGVGMRGGWVGRVISSCVLKAKNKNKVLIHLFDMIFNLGHLSRGLPLV